MPSPGGERGRLAVGAALDREPVLLEQVGAAGGRAVLLVGQLGVGGDRVGEADQGGGELVDASGHGVDLGGAEGGHPAHPAARADGPGRTPLRDLPSSGGLRHPRGLLRPLHGPLLGPARLALPRSGRPAPGATGARRRVWPRRPHDGARRPARRRPRRGGGPVRALRGSRPRAASGCRGADRAGRGAAARRIGVRRLPRPAGGALRGRPGRRAGGDAPRHPARRHRCLHGVGPRRGVPAPWPPSGARRRGRPGRTGRARAAGDPRRVTSAS